MGQSLPDTHQDEDAPEPTRERGADEARRRALVERIRAKATEADGGAWTSLAGLTDEEIIAALSSR